MKLLGRLLIGLLVLALLVVIGLVGHRAWRQHQLAQGWRITSPNGIDEAKFVRINGLDQWITIRGEDRSKPAILFLHGGPSEANSPFVGFYRPFEKDFVFVQWDQPGAGKTFIRAGARQPKLALSSMATDGIAVAEYLRKELGQPKIILIGQDWGGLLGVEMIRRRPDLFQAFVGTGMGVNWLAEQVPQYQYTKQRAAAAHDQKTLDALRRLGPPPYRSLAAYRQFGNDAFEKYKPAEDRASENALRGGLYLAPSLTFPEMFGWAKGLRSGEETLTPVMMTTDLRTEDSRFAVPIFFIQGADDIITPSSLVSQYLANVQAPAKRLDDVPHASHMVMWQHPAEFLTILKQDLASVSATGPRAAEPSA